MGWGWMEVEVGSTKQIADTHDLIADSLHYDAPTRFDVTFAATCPTRRRKGCSGWGWWGEGGNEIRPSE